MKTKKFWVGLAAACVLMFAANSVRADYGRYGHGNYGHHHHHGGYYNYGHHHHHYHPAVRAYPSFGIPYGGYYGGYNSYYRPYYGGYYGGYGFRTNYYGSGVGLFIGF